jgi:hypothetical protein
VKKLGSRDRVGRWHVGRVCLRTGMAAASGRGPWNRFPLLRFLSHAPLLFGVGDVFCPLPSAPPPPGVPSRLTDPTTSGNPNVCSLGQNRLFRFSSYRVFGISFCDPNRAQGTVQMKNWKRLVFSQLVRCIMVPPPSVIEVRGPAKSSFSARPSLEFLAKC